MSQMTAAALRREIDEMKLAIAGLQAKAQQAEAHQKQPTFKDIVLVSTKGAQGLVGTGACAVGGGACIGAGVAALVIGTTAAPPAAVGGVATLVSAAQAVAGALWGGVVGGGGTAMAVQGATVATVAGPALILGGLVLVVGGAIYYYYRNPDEKAARIEQLRCHLGLSDADCTPGKVH